jgi:tyrosyl-tRNA synthetase
MSKSFGNYIGLSETPRDMFGKIMSIRDDLMIKYFTLLTDVPESEIEQLRKDALMPARGSLSPKEWKEKLSFEIVRTYQGEKEAEKAKAEFKRVFESEKAPEEIKEVKIQNRNINIVDLLVKIGLAPSKSEARRLVKQGGVRVDGRVAKDALEHVNLKDGIIVQVGKRKFARLSLC